MLRTNERTPIINTNNNSKSNLLYLLALIIFQDLYVKTEGNVLTVHARQQTSGSSKEFQQKFSIPAGVKIEKLSSSLSKSGVLTISAPRSELLWGFLRMYSFEWKC